MTTANFLEKAKKNYGKAFFAVKNLGFAPLASGFILKMQIFYFFYKGLRYSKLDIYKCPFSKKIVKYIFVKNAHNIYYKITRPYIIRYLKKGDLCTFICP
jgi:hypothetical protein